MMVNSAELIVISIRLECIEGYYGEECGSICGYCLDNTTCHHVTGSCDKGCQPGYQEPNCTLGDSPNIQYTVLILKRPHVAQIAQ